MSEIERATLAQIRQARGGFIDVASDVFEIVERIGQIDENLRVYPRYGYWEIKEVGKDGQEYPVTTVQELDGRLLEHLRRISHPDWDANAERDKIDKEREKAIDDEAKEEIGKRAEVLAHAVRKDLNPGRAFVPKELHGT